MADRVQLGLIGAIKHPRAYHGRAFVAHLDALLAAVCDPDPEAAGALAEQAGAQALGDVAAMAGAR